MSARADLVVVNANDPQLPQVDWLVRTLRDRHRGAFEGRIWLLTTGVSDRVRPRLARQGVEIVHSDLSPFARWSFAPVVGAYEHLKRDAFRWSERVWRQDGLSIPARRRLAAPIHHVEDLALRVRARRLAGRQGLASDVVRGSFESYARKHFSKFGLAAPLQRALDVERVLLLDSDVVFQRPVSALFDRVRGEACLVEYEQEAIEGDYHIAGSNRLARGCPHAECLRFGADAHEVNVGMLCAGRDTLLDVMADWRALVLSPAHEHLYVAHYGWFWHEQDFFRLLHDWQPSRFEAAGKDLVYHAAHGAADRVDEIDGNRYSVRPAGVEPCIVHFAGGTWRRFPGLRHAYARSLDQVLESGEGITRTAVFGSGTDAERFLAVKPFDEDVVAIVDNDPARHGRRLRSCEIQAPAALATVPYDRVWIASPAVGAITNQLTAAGVARDRVVSLRSTPRNLSRLEMVRCVHAGMPLVIVGGGPSLRLSDLEEIAASELPTLAFDDIYLTYPHTRFRADLVVIDDVVWAMRHQEGIRAIGTGMRLAADALGRFVRDDERTTWVGLEDFAPRRETVHFSEDPLNLASGGGSLHTALQLACWMSCDPIVLVGVDFPLRRPETRDGLQPLRRPDVGAGVAGAWIECGPEHEALRALALQGLAAAALHLTRRGLRFLNGSRASTLDPFPRVELEEALAAARDAQGMAAARAALAETA